MEKVGTQRASSSGSARREAAWGDIEGTDDGEGFKYVLPVPRGVEKMEFGWKFLNVWPQHMHRDQGTQLRKGSVLRVNIQTSWLDRD